MINLLIDYYGSQIWIKNGLVHRLNGPAYISGDDYKLWYYYNECIFCFNQTDFERVIRRRIFE